MCACVCINQVESGRVLTFLKLYFIIKNKINRCLYVVDVFRYRCLFDNGTIFDSGPGNAVEESKTVGPFIRLRQLITDGRFPVFSLRAAVVLHGVIAPLVLVWAHAETARLPAVTRWGHWVTWLYCATSSGHVRNALYSVQIIVGVWTGKIQT